MQRIFLMLLKSLIAFAFAFLLISFFDKAWSLYRILSLFLTCFSVIAICEVIAYLLLERKE